MDAANTSFRQFPGKQDQSRDARVKNFVNSRKVKHTASNALIGCFSDGDELKDAAEVKRTLDTDIQDALLDVIVKVRRQGR